MNQKVVQFLQNLMMVIINVCCSTRTVMEAVQEQLFEAVIWCDLSPCFESRLGQYFPHLSRPALGPTQPPVQRVPGLSQGKERPGYDADPSPPSSAVVKKEQSYTSTPPMGCTACTQPQCLYKGALYLFFPCYLHVAKLAFNRQQENSVPLNVHPLYLTKCHHTLGIQN